MLLEMDCCDLLQPEVGRCGGVTALLKISALAEARGKLVVPHRSSVYSDSFVVTRHDAPFAAFLTVHPEPTEAASISMPMPTVPPAFPYERRARFAGNANRFYRLELAL